jgi:peptide/nickel transport system permease protein
VSAYVIRRLLQTLVVLFAVITIVFVLFRLLPGDPTSMLVDQSLDELARQRLLVEWGLDKSLFVQYLTFLKNIASFNFGLSFYYQAPVWQAIYTAWWNTVVLMGIAMIIAFVAGVVIGAYLGWWRGSTSERVGLATALCLRSMPIFWLGILVLMVFSYWLHLFPTGGMRQVGYHSTSLIGTYLSFDFMLHLALPLLTAALYFVADPMMVMRACMLEVKGEDFLEYLDALGFSERDRMRHCARNAMLPVVTFASIMVGFVFGGQVLLEIVFAWPGIGREMVLAIERRDYPVAQATFIVMSVIVILMNFVVDILYSQLDPRIRYA